MSSEEEKGEELAVEDHHQAAPQADEEVGAGPDDDEDDNAQVSRPHPVRRVHFVDHFSLKNPSSSVRFRGSNVRVYEQRSSQLLLEEQHQDEEQQEAEILVKKIKNERNFGLNFLRFTYVLVCLLFAGILFIFCFQVLLFLFMDLVPAIGAIGQEGKSVVGFVGTLFAIPMYVYGLSSAMSIAGTFTVDTWAGHKFLRSVGQCPVVFSEWFALAIFIGIPLVVCVVLIFASVADWWEITSLTWFCCVAAFYVLFAGAVIYYEIHSTLWFLRQDGDNSWRGLLRRAILIRQTHLLSGVKTYIRMTDVRKNEDETPQHTYTSLYSRMTQSRCCGRLFEKMDPPERLYSTQEVIGSRQFVTSTTWSLEKVFCARDRTKSIAVVSGPSALRPAQVRSSFLCVIFGSLLALLFFIAILVYYESSGLFIALIALVIFLCCIPNVLTTTKLYGMYKDARRAQALDEEVKDDEPSAEGEKQPTDTDSDAIYQTYETYRFTRPRTCLCWVVFFLLFILFVVWPVVVLFAIENYAVAGLFLIVSIVSLARIYFDPAVIVSEQGSFETFSKSIIKTDRSSGSDDAEKLWKSKARLSTILLNVTRGPATTVWAWIFVLLVLILVVFSVQAIGTSNEQAAGQAENAQILPLGAFEYEPQPKLPYPTCRLAKGLALPDSNSAALADYAFLAALAYQRTDRVQANLDQWFGEDVAFNDEDTVAKFREVVPGGQSAVSYRLITFDGGSIGVVVVRGSTTPWEWLTDAQLWASAYVVQIVRDLLPAGEIFTPILDQLLAAVSWLESKSLSRVALYKQTTSLVQALQASGNYTTIHITGHSLGGGITIITGAQTGIPAVAISGPNAKLSRRTFDPPLSLEALNTNVFNIVPDRDLVPRVDDLGDLYQRIQCRAPRNEIWACHSGVRSLCDILYQCGTWNRPGVCACATTYGYPEPTQVGNTTFTELCGTERSNSG